MLTIKDIINYNTYIDLLIMLVDKQSFTSKVKYLCLLRRLDKIY